MAQGVGPEVWQSLLRAALRLVDSLPAAGYGTLDFRMGGGTVLALAFDHRTSNDIDLFIDDAQALGFLTPRLNDTAARLTGDYQEAANTLKLVLPEGDIDFIVAGPVTREPAQASLDIDRRSIPIDPIAEILAKKLLFRAATFKPRDLFDLAVALVKEPEAGRSAIAATKTVHPLLLRRLSALRSLPLAELMRGIVVRPSGQSHVDGMTDRVIEAVERCE